MLTRLQENASYLLEIVNVLIGEREKKIIHRENDQESGGGGRHCCNGCSGCTTRPVDAEEGAAAETDAAHFEEIC